MTPRPRRTALRVLRGGEGQGAQEDLDDDVDVVAGPSADPFAGREIDDPLLGADDRADRSGPDDEDDPDGEGRWLAARGRWGVPVLAAAALLVLAAVVALVLGVRAGALAPAGGTAVVASSTGQEAAGRPGPAAGGEPAADGPPTVERTGPVVGGAVDGPTRQPGAAASPEASGPGAGPGEGSDAAAPLTVHVVGAVVAPGVVTVRAGARTVDAVAAAGGMTPDADPAGVNLAAPLADGQQVVVPRPGEVVPAAPALVGAASGRGAPAAPAAPLDVNTASAAELDALPGIGPVLAGRIVETRDAHGPFAAVDELVEVPGIGDAVLERLRPLVRV